MRHPHGETVVIHPYMEETGTDPYGESTVSGVRSDVLAPSVQSLLALRRRTRVDTTEP